MALLVLMLRFLESKFDEKYITHNYEDVDFCLRFKKKFPKYKFYISLNSFSSDILDKSKKENMILRIKFIYLFFLKNKNIYFFFIFVLSFFGLILSNLNKLNFKLIIELLKFL